ncbi:MULTISPECIES: hypothetical protein [Bacillus cereus group]|uniref:hypothetical protein n=1 Tax=Bacillus cereus group TaxID=86661 RepID=UPI0005E6052C|nr:MULTISPECIES: hypothetical protein [Bacillus cereus group]CGG48043.1 Uncharacterised protein [Streptococcus pneumoniae]MDA2089777.1 hypothetical protein [Bacillus cereus]MDA2363091.1 hypothetical protein [Bacillus cereus]MDA2368167.1 hypothetical protein [Bacillus cereus]MDA2373442.1 hypothetical protein [Bacillus cereus]
MLADDHIIQQREQLNKHLEKTYNLNTENLTYYNNFSSSILKSIVSFKLWNRVLDRSNSISDGPSQYLKETISNINQVLILGVLGFKSPSYSMIRRSLENIISFIYFKDHPIEFAKKKTDPEYKNLSVKEMGDYIKQYPYSYYYDTTQINLINNFTSQIMGLWKSEYQELSKFVHGSNDKYFDLNSFVEEILPHSDTLKKIENHILTFSSIVNTLNIIFFSSLYANEFSEEEKQVIRRAITQDGYKRNIQEIFGEI